MDHHAPIDSGEKIERGQRAEDEYQGNEDALGQNQDSFQAMFSLDNHSL
jgi:hypothetical protein